MKRPTKISRLKARESGLKRYFTGKPCKHGHVVERWISTRACYECLRASVSRWARNNKDKKNKINKSWQKKNPQVTARHNKKWHQNNRETCRAYWHNYNSKKKSGGKHTAQQIKNLLIKQKFKCKKCRKSIKKKYHADHIKPISKGGRNGIKNIQMLCPPCNLRKGAKY